MNFAALMAPASAGLRPGRRTAVTLQGVSREKRAAGREIRTDMPRPVPLRRPRPAAALLVLLTAWMPQAAPALTAAEIEDDMFWKGVGGCENIKGAELYQQTSPEGRHAAEAAECIAWSKVKGCDDVERVAQFVRKFPAGRYAAEAAECIAWSKVKGCERREPVAKFLRDFSEGRFAAEAQTCLARLDTRRRVERLLRECRVHREAGRLTAGGGGNALDCYRKALDLDPGNEQALQGIEDIDRHYIEKALAALARERPAAAQRAVERLVAVSPEHPQVEELNERVEELKRALAERDRRAGEREALRREIEALLAQGEHEQALERLAAARKEGLEGKALAALERRAEEGLARAELARKRETGVAEARALLENGDFAGARVRLARARESGLDDETHAALATAIDEAEAAARRTAQREALLAESDARLARGEYEAAREALGRAREVGLPEPDYARRAARIDRAAESARAEEIRRLLARCDRHLSQGRLQSALDCFREILALDPGHADARRDVPILERLIAWEEAERAHSVERYFEFEQDHAGSRHAMLARSRLEELETQYWSDVVQTADTREAYARYLEIYPQGRYAALAKRRVSEGE